MEEPTAPAGLDIHGWFGLSYSNYLVLHRTLLQSMPLPWQHRFVAMLEELTHAFAHEPLPEAFEVTAAIEREVGELTAGQLAQLGITVAETAECDCASPARHNLETCDSWPTRTYTSPDGTPMEHWHRVLVPTPDPVPPYDRGRTRLTPQLHSPAPSTGS